VAETKLALNHERSRPKQHGANEEENSPRDRELSRQRRKWVMKALPHKSRTKQELDSTTTARNRPSSNEKKEASDLTATSLKHEGHSSQIQNASEANWG
jgi:hypothetical protein